MFPNCFLSVETAFQAVKRHKVEKKVLSQGKRCLILIELITHNPQSHTDLSEAGRLSESVNEGLKAI